MSIQTLRHKLPLLAVGQAQKEHTHNEALLLIDTIANLSVRGIINDPIIAGELASDIENEAPQSWLVGNQPLGVWQGHVDQIATWSQSGWRYLSPLEGMQIYHYELKCKVIYKDAHWRLAESIEIAQGGSNIDEQARESIRMILTMLQQFGLSRI